MVYPLSSMRRALITAALLGALACGEEPSDPEPKVQSVARQWNDALLAAIRNDLARPNVHARNLFHSSALMFDAWAVFDDVASPVFLGTERGGQPCTFSPETRERYRATDDRRAARETAISYGMYRLLSHRFRRSPGAIQSLVRFEDLLVELGHDPEDDRLSVTTGDPVALGNALAACVIAFGSSDGANEAGDYGNLYYEPVNSPLDPTRTGNPDIVDPNRWQPLNLDNFVDQAGIPASAPPPFQGAEWGNVTPFALDGAVVRQRDGDDYSLFLDPGAPPMLGAPDEALYVWGHALVAEWSALLDPELDAPFDISPARIGNADPLPSDFFDYPSYYRADGTQASAGWAENPVTGEPYAPNLVPKGDYGRVVAEYWADGPDSETPPGHWFTIANELVFDDPVFEPRDPVTGEPIDALEWDVKLYLALGGAVHDAAIAAWSAKGWYDYVRPISALRYMGERGQSSDPSGPSYDPSGLPLIPGLIEVVELGDPLAGLENENVGAMKVRAWRGPDYIANPARDVAGVGWILIGDWWPYQRPTFVTPPFAGYVSGHSTFSRAAAEVLAELTGSGFFPGGIAEFKAERDQFLVFERGPSVDVTLQWATYVDAANESGLSRIYGGIHPPLDDVPGRRMGIEVARLAVARARAHFGSP